ncbi:hypothetical protein L1N85_20435 [Paenibacillus alkaliterrae]|uniref:hypothetical protein n=1 Tax=Paenibacillus alkaliterrae TaxID=320909 RepID=UPI001F438885|nr:hypothetical protein [Paenibacillus alkaliterrae]MCF2940763.1 hypothetical protein [Paenibacillus alkaliterrae]
MRRVDRATLLYRCRRLLLAGDGAVAIFSVIVLSSLLLFFSLLIDYARIAAFHKLTEDVVRSGIRSVLSAYDAALYERYGLFGRGGTDGELLFTEVLEANADENMNSIGESYKLIRMKPETSKLHTADFLGKHDVFARQVLEDMKYKAPVDFTLELAARFAPMAGAMKEAAVTVSLLENMRRLYEKREAHLALVLELQEQAAAIVRGSGIDALIPVRTAELAAGGDTAFAIVSEYGSYASQVMHDQSVPAEGETIYENEIHAYEEKARAVGMELRRLSSELLKSHEKLQGDARKELETARLLNTDMQRLVQQASASTASDGYDAVSRSSVTGAGQYQVPASAAADIEQVRKSADELVLAESWFNQYSQELSAQGSAASAIHMETGSFQSSSLASMSRPIASLASDGLLEGVASLRLAYGMYEEKYIRPGAILASRRQTLESGNVKAQLKHQEEQAGVLWKQARGMLHGLTAIPQTEEHMKLFELVRKRYNDNLLFNQQSDAATVSYEQGADIHDAAKQSAALMDGLFTGMAGMLERTRDTLYVGEYVVGRFPSFAPQNLRMMMTEGDLTELSHAIAFNNQEAEYILYGFHNPVGNIIAAYGELFAARLAVRTMEGLIESRSLGHPLLILSAALLYGLEKTMEDLLAFSERGTAPLSKFVKAELSYKDYLRLFMLMHDADEGSRLARMIAVIEQNSGTTLSAVPSGVTGEARISMELWFVSGLMRELGRFGLLEGKVVGNRYEATQTIGWSY